MEPFEIQFTVEAEHTDALGQAKPSALMYYCQEAAGGHCKQLGLDWAALQTRGLFWALIRTQVQVCRLPRLGERLTVQTWPMPTTRSAFPRAVLATDEQGNCLFRATSLWVLVDTQTRRMLLPGRSGVTLEGITLGGELPMPESLPPIAGQVRLCRRVGPEDLDRNRHMNNTRYMDWLFDLFPPQKSQIKGFAVCYLAEALEGQELAVSSQYSPEGKLLFEITRHRENTPEKPERIFAAAVDF